MNYQIIQFNSDCPQTYFYEEALRSWFKTQGIGVVESSNYKALINCLLHDVVIRDCSLIDLLTRTSPKQNLLLYGCLDENFLLDWNDKVGVVLTEATNPPNVSGIIQHIVYGDTIGIKIGQGCTGSCTFCRLRNRKHVFRSAEDIARDVYTWHLRFPQLQIMLCSDDCGACTSDLITLIQQLRLDCPGVSLNIQSVNTKYFLTNKESFIELFSSKILKSIGISVQSGSPTILKAMGRPNLLDDLKLALGEINRILPEGSFTYSEFIHGFPGETGKDLGMSLEFSLLFTYVLWYRYTQIKHTKTSITHPDVLCGNGDVSQIIYNYGLAHGKPAIIVGSSSVIHKTKQQDVRWAIK